MCPSIPSSVRNAARFGAPCPQKRPPLLVLETRSSSALALNRRFVESNDTGVCRLGTNHGFLHSVTALPQLGPRPRGRTLRTACPVQKTRANQRAQPFRWVQTPAARRVRRGARVRRRRAAARDQTLPGPNQLAVAGTRQGAPAPCPNRRRGPS